MFCFGCTCVCGLFVVCVFLGGVCTVFQEQTPLSYLGFLCADLMIHQV